jgi:predicted nucleic acid-binding protein
MRPSRPKRLPISQSTVASLRLRSRLPRSCTGCVALGREDRVALFEASLANADVLPFDDGAARLAGRINADLERAGRIIGLPDVMIAAIAIRSALRSSRATPRTLSMSAR